MVAWSRTPIMRLPYEPQDRRAARQEYYRILRNVSSVGEFDSEIDRVIMTMTAEGARQRDIERELNTMGIPASASISL